MFRALIDLVTFRWLTRLIARPPADAPGAPPGEPSAPPVVPARRPDTRAGSIAMSSAAVEELAPPRTAPRGERTGVTGAAAELEECVNAAVAALDASLERAKTRASLGPHLHGRANAAVARWAEVAPRLEGALAPGRLERCRAWFAQLEECYRELAEREEELTRRHEAGMTEMSRTAQAMGSLHRTKLSELLRDGRMLLNG